MDTLPDVDRLVAAYAAAKNAKAALDKQVESIEADMEALKDAIQRYMQGENLQGFKTTDGATVSLRVTNRFFSGDMPAFRVWARANDALDLFENRLHQGNVDEWLKANPENVPPGLQSQSKTSVVIKAPKAAKE